MIRTNIFKKDAIEHRVDFRKAKDIFEELVLFMQNEDIQKKLEVTHKRYAKSGDIQNIIVDKTRLLGFTSEKKGLFKNQTVSQLRPDYFLELENSSGIIMEVERGKTLANNMDLLDLWKCHICEKANFLFLIIPNIRQTKSGRNIIFESVERRMATFFGKENYTNVDAVFIIGY